jgi:methylmalonyl-CoA epimerase
VTADSTRSAPAANPEIRRIHHVGIVVADARAAAETFRRGLGLEPIAEEESSETRVVFVAAGESRLELIEPLDPASPWGAALRDGEGVHHVALEVVDLRAAVAALASRGVDAVDPRPRREAGSVLSVWLDVRATGGMRIELVQQIRSSP